jgi:poly-gamma-glutamate capsule biosynthesis protein CapA/YwtB (metallophosphatase superfamily)
VRSTLTIVCLPLGIALLAIVGLRSPGHTTTLAATGDIMLGRGLTEAHNEGGWDQVLTALDPITSSADISFANLESPLTDAPLVNETLDLRAPLAAAAALQAAGFNIVSLANNHSLDAGEGGLQDTMHALRSIGVQMIGPRATPVEMTSKGIQLIWFAFDDTDRSLDPNTLRDLLQTSRRSNSLIAVSIHWGSELETVPNERQRTLAELLANAGADIILGHHPHVLQPVVWLWGDGRGRPTLVAYSLGNAIFDQVSPPGVRYGAVLVLEVSALGVRQACSIPFQTNPSTLNVQSAGIQAAASVARSLVIECILPLGNSPDS